jgi:hypothetical protein
MLGMQLGLHQEALAEALVDVCSATTVPPPPASPSSTSTLVTLLLQHKHQPIRNQLDFMFETTTTTTKTATKYYVTVFKFPKIVSSKLHTNMTTNEVVTTSSCIDIDDNSCDDGSQGDSNDRLDLYHALIFCFFSIV